MIIDIQRCVEKVTEILCAQLDNDFPAKEYQIVENFDELICRPTYAQSDLQVENNISIFEFSETEFMDIYGKKLISDLLEDFKKIREQKIIFASPPTNCPYPSFCKEGGKSKIKLQCTFEKSFAFPQKGLICRCWVGII